jgi:hypothetical protein
MEKPENSVIPAVVCHHHNPLKYQPISKVKNAIPMTGS